MAKIYQENQQEQKATYKLDHAGSEIFNYQSEVNFGTKTLDQASNGLKRGYSAGDLQEDAVPSGLPQDE